MYNKVFVTRNCVYQERRALNRDAQYLLPDRLFDHINNTAQTTEDLNMRRCCVELLRRMNGNKWGYIATGNPAEVAGGNTQLVVHLSFDANLATSRGHFSQKYVLEFDSDRMVCNIVEQPSGRRMANFM